MSPSSEIDAALKTESLHQVAGSSTFNRAGQLRNFLNYVCKMEIEGRASEITEYTIGVEALGRPDDFLATEDTSVRNRAHALRQKLLEYYTLENPQAVIHIELPKGSYVPQFRMVDSAKPAPRLARFNLRSALLGFVAASLLALIATIALAPWEGYSHADPILVEAWGPIAVKNANPLIVFGVSANLSLRAYPLGSHPDTPPFDIIAPPEAAAYYGARFAMPPDNEIHMAGTAAFRVGEVLGALEVVQTLVSFHTSYQVLPDRAAPPASLRRRNVLLFGDPYVPSVAMHLARGAFAFEYDPSLRDFVIQDRDAKAPRSHFFAPSARESGSARDYPGLLTILPSEDTPDGSKRTVVFAGLSSAACQAAAEYFSSAKSMRDLRERFRKEGIKGFPAAYQVVVKARTDGLLLLSSEYQTHRVLDRLVH